MANDIERALARRAQRLAAGVLCCLALVTPGASAARLPDGYAELEYLESTGLQYVDTGYVPTGRDVVEADFAFTDATTTQQRVFGTSTWNGGYLTCAFYVNGNGFYAWAYKDGTGNWTSTGVKASAERRRLILDGVDGQVVLEDAASGETLYSAAMGTTHVKSAARPLLLFANCYDDKDKVQEHGRLRLYSCAISDSARQKVRDFVPCRRISDGEPGLYDTVEGAFFADAGGTGFVAGPFADGTAFSVSQPEDQTLVAGVPCTPAVVVTDKATGDVLEEGTHYSLAYLRNAAAGEAWAIVTGLGDYAGDVAARTFNVFPAHPRVPDGYRELKWIVSSGTEFIQTDMVATPRTTATIDATPFSVSGGSVLFKATSASNVVDGLVFHGYVNAMGMFAATCGDATGFGDDGFSAAVKPWNAWGASTASSFRFKANTRHRFTVDSFRDVCEVDGQTVFALKTERTKNSMLPFRLFDGLCGRLHSFAVSEDGGPARVFLPCVREADGAAGLYDLAAGSFLTNASSAGAFTAGPYAFSRELAVAPIATQPWDGATAVRPSPAVFDRATGAALAEDVDYSLAFSGNAAAGLATVVVTGLGDYAGSAATNSFAIHRAGGAFTYASWNVDGFKSGPTANGTIRWEWTETHASCESYRTFLSSLGADWLGVDDSVYNFLVGGWSQIGSRWGVFLDYPQTTLGDETGDIPRATFCNGRFEILSSETVEDCAALEQRVKVDGLYEAVFVNVRLDDDAAVRDAQIAALATRYSGEPRVVISGDFRTECTGVDGKSITGWAALAPLVKAGFRLANVSEPLAPVWKRATPRFASTHVATKGFAVSDVAARAPFASDDDEYGLSDECALVCMLAPLAEGRVMRPSNPAPQVYAGAALTPVVTADSAYSVALPENAVDAGEYSVTVSLMDKSAAAWDDGTTDDLTLTFTVEKASNAWKTPPSISSTLWERRDGPAGTISQGEGVFGGTSTCSHTDAQLATLTKGTHRIVFTVPETANYAGLEQSVDVTVTETFRTTVSADGATADVQFSHSDKPRKLYLVYGFADGGNSTSAWDRVVCVGDVAPGVTEWTGIELPDTVGYEHPNYRFLVSGDYGSESYAMDGLMAQWDAEENSGRGVHAETSETWAELVNATPVSLTGTPVYGEKGVKMNGAFFEATLAGAADAINARALTVQVMMRPDSVNAWKWYQGVFQFGPGGSNRQLILDTRLQDELGQSLYTFGGLQYRESAWNGRSAILTPNWYFGTNVLVTVTVDASGAHLWFDGASAPAFTTEGGGVEATSDLFTFGNYIGNETYPMTVHSIRIYNRTLTADEIAANYAVDADRFDGRFVEAGELQTASRPVLAEVHGGAWADVRFTAVPRPQKLWFVWGARDSGARTNGWAGAALVADVPAGVASFERLALPAASRGAGCGRFLLAWSEYLSTDYATDGLLAQWDGIDNAARNVHESSPTSWVDLVAGRAMSVYGSPTFGANFVHNNADSYFQAAVPGVADAINAEAFTIQAMICPDRDSWQKYQGVFQFGPGGGNRQLILDTRPDAPGAARWSFCGLQYRENTWNGRSVVSEPNWYFGSNVLVTVTTDKSGAHLWFDGASAPVFTTKGGGVEATSDLFTFGNYIGNKSYPMTAYGIRIYNRTLTADEIAASRAVDAVRFLGAEPPWQASAPLEIAAPTLIILR